MCRVSVMMPSSTSGTPPASLMYRYCHTPGHSCDRARFDFTVRSGSKTETQAITLDNIGGAYDNGRPTNSRHKYDRYGGEILLENINDGCTVTVNMKPSAGNIGPHLGIENFDIGIYSHALDKWAILRFQEAVSNRTTTFVLGTENLVFDADEFESLGTNATGFWTHGGDMRIATDKSIPTDTPGCITLSCRSPECIDGILDVDYNGWTLDSTHYLIVHWWNESGVYQAGYNVSTATGTTSSFSRPQAANEYIQVEVNGVFSEMVAVPIGVGQNMLPPEQLNIGYPPTPCPPDFSGCGNPPYLASIIGKECVWYVDGLNPNASLVLRHPTYEWFYPWPGSYLGGMVTGTMTSGMYQFNIGNVSDYRTPRSVQLMSVTLIPHDAIMYFDGARMWIAFADNQTGFTTGFTCDGTNGPAALIFNSIPTQQYQTT